MCGVRVTIHVRVQALCDDAVCVCVCVCGVHLTMCACFMS